MELVEGRLAGIGDVMNYYAEKIPEDFPLYFHPKWLNLVCKGKWNVVIVLYQGEIMGAHPYCIFSDSVKPALTMPEFTPVLGPYVRKRTFSSNTKALSYEMEVLEKLMAQLPDFKAYDYKWHPACKNWLPFYWAGFNQSTRYTYVLHKPETLEIAWKNVKEAAQRQIKKGRKFLSITQHHDAERFYALIKHTYKNQKTTVPYSVNELDNLLKGIAQEKMGAVFTSYDEAGNDIGSLLIVWDSENYYYLIGGLNHEIDTHGTMSFLLWHICEMAFSEGKSFDFQGSMIKPIERFFRNFGGELTPYFKITKTNTTIMERLLHKIKKT
ncbi:MAG: GNAT family N-acetyltransferase [Bacteroidia bacterium]|nr:GNAT family N-acetyltransferase [Bacteroidia bacterium]